MFLLQLQWAHLTLQTLKQSEETLTTPDHKTHFVFRGAVEGGDEVFSVGWYQLWEQRLKQQERPPKAVSLLAEIKYDSALFTNLPSPSIVVNIEDILGRNVCKKSKTTVHCDLTQSFIKAS